MCVKPLSYYYSQGISQEEFEGAFITQCVKPLSYYYSQGIQERKKTHCVEIFCVKPLSYYYSQGIKKHAHGEINYIIMSVKPLSYYYSQGINYKRIYYEKKSLNVSNPYRITTVRE